MTDWNNPTGQPTPEELAAYLDGELPGTQRDQVESWLAGHPEAAREMAGCRRVNELYRQTPPAEPPPAAWAAVWQRVEAGLPSAARRSAPQGRWRAGLILGAAAAAVLALLLTRSFWNRPIVPPGDDDNVPFPVVSANEVTILSMEPRDVAALVVGQPPLGEHEAIELASHQDIRLLPGLGADARLIDWAAAPMIVDALVLGDDREP